MLGVDHRDRPVPQVCVGESADRAETCLLDLQRSFQRCAEDDPTATDQCFRSGGEPFGGLVHTGSPGDEPLHLRGDPVQVRVESFRVGCHG